MAENPEPSERMGSSTISKGTMNMGSASLHLVSPSHAKDVSFNDSSLEPFERISIPEGNRKRKRKLIDAAAQHTATQNERRVRPRTFSNTINVTVITSSSSASTFEKGMTSSIKEEQMLMDYV